MNHREEQLMELEALQAIFSEELKVVEGDGQLCFDIHVKAEDDMKEFGVVLVYCWLRFTLVSDYPELAPLIEVVGSSENLCDMDAEGMVTHLLTQAEENRGTAMIYTLIGSAQECLLNVVRSIHSEMKRRKAEAEDEQRRIDEIKYKGTPVSLENFLAWKITFDEEMKVIGRAKIKEDVSTKKLTGRQLFEKDASLFTSDVDFITADAGSVKVDESLFQDLEDLEDLELNDSSDDS